VIQLAKPLIRPYKSKRYDEAFPVMLRLAERGYPNAVAIVGVMYLRGEGTAKDGDQAAHWLRNASEAGNKEAQSILGIMYLSGIGVAPNLEEGKKWLTLAAQQGDKRSLEILRNIAGGKATKM
jgi:uncharacterized protein